MANADGCHGATTVLAMPSLCLALVAAIAADNAWARSAAVPFPAALRRTVGAPLIPGRAAWC